MLVAKAIEDWPLYSGQETSSRYIDMSKQALIDPVGTEASRRILDHWMSFYLESQPVVAQHLQRKYPRRPDEKEAIYERAIKARTFDILRGFLPAGITTKLSWHTNLRQAHDKLILLHHHPLREVREVAQLIHDALRAKYPHSFSHKTDEAGEAYRQLLGEKYTYYLPQDPPNGLEATTTIQSSQLERYAEVLSQRPKKTNLPIFLAELGMITFDFRLDFGSFRDIHRHRNGVCRMPLLTTGLGFHQWYLDELPSALRAEAEMLIESQTKAIWSFADEGESREEGQYYIAMGFDVACRVSYGLPATVYVTELRSGRTVHPTLRRVAHQMDRFLRRQFPTLALHSDLDPDDWDIRRGQQTISFAEKKEKKSY